MADRVYKVDRSVYSDVQFRNKYHKLRTGQIVTIYEKVESVKSEDFEQWFTSQIIKDHRDISLKQVLSGNEKLSSLIQFQNIVLKYIQENEGNFNKKNNWFRADFLFMLNERNKIKSMLCRYPDKFMPAFNTVEDFVTLLKFHNFTTCPDTSKLELYKQAKSIIKYGNT